MVVSNATPDIQAMLHINVAFGILVALHGAITILDVSSSRHSKTACELFPNIAKTGYYLIKLLKEQKMYTVY